MCSRRDERGGRGAFEPLEPAAAASKPSPTHRYLMVTSNKSLQKAALGFAVLVMLPSFKVLVAFFAR